MGGWNHESHSDFGDTCVEPPLCKCYTPHLTEHLLDAHAALRLDHIVQRHRRACKQPDHTILVMAHMHMRPRMPQKSDADPLPVGNSTITVISRGSCCEVEQYHVRSQLICHIMQQRRPNMEHTSTFAEVAACSSTISSFGCSGGASSAPIVVWVNHNNSKHIHKGAWSNPITTSSEVGLSTSEAKLSYLRDYVKMPLKCATSLKATASYMYITRNYVPLQLEKPGSRKVRHLQRTTSVRSRCSASI